jgi:hypothetical protein
MPPAVAAVVVDAPAVVAAAVHVHMYLFWKKVSPTSDKGGVSKSRRRCGQSTF